MIGPIVGAILYYYLEFQYTFYLTGLIFLCLGPLLYQSIPKTIDIKDVISSENINHSDLSMDEKERVSYFKLFMNPKFIINSVAAFMCYFSVILSEPVFVLRVEEFGLNTTSAGLVFSLTFLALIISCILMSKLSGKLQNKTFILGGVLIATVGQFLVGPAHLLPNKLWILAIGQFLIGFSVAPILISSLPLLTNIACEIYPKRKIEASDVSSGAFNSMLGLGQMVGPLYGSYITTLFDFRICTSIFGIVLLTFSLIYYLIEFKKYNFSKGKDVYTELENKSLEKYLEEVL
mmetsp:Transcript_2424/g.2849  ORF Transcript_2424/g.2849 Transcript_2424/m.2849 type:complete len:291 (+) Transcript_2424:458-1330(+)